MYGQIRSEWKREGEDINMVIEVPANTTSTVVLPKGTLLINNTPVKKSDFTKNFQTGSKSKQFELGSGVYSLKLMQSLN
jgi:alpha-L-rhamnosidase